MEKKFPAELENSNKTILCGTSIKRLDLMFDENNFFCERDNDERKSTKSKLLHFFIKPIYRIARDMFIENYYKPESTGFQRTVDECANQRWMNFAAFGKLMEINYASYALMHKKILIFTRL